MKAIFEKLAKLREIFRNKGFWDTMNILGEYTSISEGIEYHTFNKIMNTGSYYNSFRRAKQFLLDYRMIEIYIHPNQQKKLIRLTEKGREIYDHLNLLQHKIELIKV
ncbi:MAG: hypothetical protein U9Q73_01820 [Nanoarchaeota archaeon]|nr:hypothetical protein [Nanoarchaeota archaeon]